MKKYYRKIIRPTLVCFAMLTGFLINGLNSAFADSYVQEPIYDVNGDNIDPNAEYYLKPVFASNQGIITENWNTGEWAKLGPESDEITVKLKPFTVQEYIYEGRPSYGILLGQGYVDVPKGVELETNISISELIRFNTFGIPPVYRTSSLYLNARSNGVELLTKWQNPNSTKWNVKNIPAIDSKGNRIANYVSFQDKSSQQYLIYKKSEDWLYVDQPSSFGQNIWKLIKK